MKTILIGIHLKDVKKQPHPIEEDRRERLIAYNHQITTITRWKRFTWLYGAFISGHAVIVNLMMLA